MGATLELAPGQASSRGRHRKQGDTRVAAYTRAQTKVNHNTRTRVQLPGFEGGHISIPSVELCCVWGMLLERRLKATDVRTWLAAREVAERRKFASAGREPVYRASELSALVGGAAPRQIRASLRKLERLGIIRWEGRWLRFIDSPESLAVVDTSGVQRLQALMPKARRSFPMPRRMLRLLAGGVKRSVLATVLGHLLTCPHYSRSKGWNGEGSCHGPRLCETFGISDSSLREARTHLVEQLGWMKRIEMPQWHVNKYGGRFELALDWNPHTLASVGEGQGAPAELSTAESGGPNTGTGPVSGGPSHKQNSSTRIQISEPVASPPGPRHESSKKVQVGPPNLRKLECVDLPNVERVMALFDQALVDPMWKAKGWAPYDSHLERLNWAAAARRVHVRGGFNPPGMFVHLVSKRLWNHVSNEDEDAVRCELARLMNPDIEAPVLGAGRRGSKRSAPKLSSDGKVLRCVEVALRRHGVVATSERVDQELTQKAGWTTERVAEARRSFEQWCAKPEWTPEICR